MEVVINKGEMEGLFHKNNQKKTNPLLTTIE